MVLKYNMTKEDKIKYLINNHKELFYRTRSEVFAELSMQQPLCCCGKLATGLHERNCKKFNNKVDSFTIKKLKHLIIK